MPFFADYLSDDLRKLIDEDFGPTKKATGSQAMERNSIVYSGAS
jgi:hypothetical protein